jgi:hypothetical protein
LRAHSWSHGVYPDYDTLLRVATETWRKVCLDPEKIRSICAVPYFYCLSGSCRPFFNGGN